MIQYNHLIDHDFVLGTPIDFQIGISSGPNYHIDQGFVFNVSIPWFLTWLLNPRNDKYFKAAAVHDHMLINGWDRVVAGAIFHQALKEDHVVLWQRFIMWVAVSFFKYE